VELEGEEEYEEVKGFQFIRWVEIDLMFASICPYIFRRIFPYDLNNAS
jgi:hypothetical protein